MVLFVPLALLFIIVVSQGNNRDVNISNTIVAKSVAVFLGIPLGAAMITRVTLRILFGPSWYMRNVFSNGSPYVP
jgi:ACR3 family arsenite transporter